MHQNNLHEKITYTYMSVMWILVKENLFCNAKAAITYCDVTKLGHHHIKVIITGIYSISLGPL